MAGMGGSPGRSVSGEAEFQQFRNMVQQVAHEVKEALEAAMNPKFETMSAKIEQQRLSVDMLAPPGH